MASRGQHLEPIEGRDIVFCHNCRHQWYQDSDSDEQPCPRCQRTFVEIVRAAIHVHMISPLTIYQVEPNCDPRMDTGSSSPEPDQRFRLHHHHHHHHHHDSDSDPEESTIEEHHFHGPGGLFGQRTIHRSPEPSGYPRRPRPRPGGSEDIIRQFSEMIREIGGPSMVGRSGPETLFHDDHGGPLVTYRTFRGPGFAGGVSSFTITTGSTAGRPRGPAASESQIGNDDPFQRYMILSSQKLGTLLYTNKLNSIFGELMAMGPPPARRDDPLIRDPTQGPGNEGGNAGRPMDIATALSQLLTSIVNPGAVHGDAVYSQEALDRIITNLMEANPQSNAPPPATENAIASLPKKKLNEEMLGPEMKGECTICIDEVRVGDEVIVLPCRHWFHEECASLWLKQHNSCPVCRATIDGAAAGKPRGEAAGAQDTPQAAESSSSSSRPVPTERRRTYLRQREERLDSIRSLGNRTRDHRRDSYSPPSQNTSAQRSPRVRSPSPSVRASNHSERSRDNQRSSGSGPLSWIRDRFSGR